MALLSQGGPLSLSGNFLKINLLFPAVLAVALSVIRTFCRSAYVGDLLSALPVSVELALYFLLTVLVFFHWVMNAVQLMAASATMPEGAENGNPRTVLYDKHPVLGRLRAASLNGFEANGIAACMVLVGSKLTQPTCGKEVADPCISSDIFARLTLLFTLTRCLYYPLYALDYDLIRSTTWLTGFLSLFAIGAAPFFGLTAYLL